MTPPKRITVNVPGVLAGRLEERMRELKFRSASAYFLSLLIFDFYKRSPHVLTGSLHHERPEVQDQFFAEIAAGFDDLAHKPPTWFDIRLRELIEERVRELEKERAQAKPE